MQYVLRYSLKPGSAAEHQNWLARNESGTGQDTGWSYVGTWFNLKGLDAYDYETRWELVGQPIAGRQPFAEETTRSMSAHLPFIASGQSYFLGTVTPIYGREQ